MNRDTLEKMVNDGLSSYAIADKTGKSKSTIWYWLLKYNLGTKRVCKCGKCGETDSLKFHSGRYTQCKKCRQFYQNKSNRKRKYIFVQYKGGKCTICGYDKCMAALDFHHSNPDEKDPDWKKMRKWSLKKVKGELDKCVLVCRNCHSEIHYPDDKQNVV